MITNKAVTQQSSFLLDSVVLASGATPTRQVNSEALLGGSETLEIQHQGERYILRQTRAGKLILTK